MSNQGFDNNDTVPPSRHHLHSMSDDLPPPSEQQSNQDASPDNWSNTAVKPQSDRSDNSNNTAVRQQGDNSDNWNNTAVRQRDDNPDNWNNTAIRQRDDNPDNWKNTAINQQGANQPIDPSVHAGQPYVRGAVENPEAASRYPHPTTRPLNASHAPAGAQGTGPQGSVKMRDKVLGKVDEMIGKFADDPDMQREGALRQAGGKAAVNQDRQQF